MSLQDVVEVRPSKVTALLQSRESRVRRSIGPVTIENVSKDVRRVVLPLHRDVGIDIQVELIPLLQRPRAGNAPVEQVGEPEKIVLLAYGPVKVDTAVGIAAARLSTFVSILIELSRLFGYWRAADLRRTS